MTPVRARIVSIGDELLCGRTIDTNAHATQKRLLARGVPVDGVAVVLDRPAHITDALDRTPDDALVVVTGGLGPTPDDLTVATIADWAGTGLEEDVAIAMHLRARCEERGYPFGPNMVKQTLRPAGFAAVVNPAGTAPGLVGRARGRLLVLLPGVPDEITALWPGVAEELERREVFGPPPTALLRRTCGLSEPGLADLTDPLRARYPDLDWSWWLTAWGVDVQAAAPAGTDVPTDLGPELDAVLGDRVYAGELVGLDAVVVAALRDRGLSVAVAESCTGGLVGAALTAVPGSSAVFRGGVLAYANEVKTAMLRVPADVLENDGAVSAATAEAMAVGARRSVDADVAVSVTGIAGPDGGTEDKPVGTTWLGLAAADGVWSFRYRFRAYRERNRTLAAAHALDAVRRHLADGGDPWRRRRS